LKGDTNQDLPPKRRLPPVICVLFRFGGVLGVKLVTAGENHVQTGQVSPGAVLKAMLISYLITLPVFLLFALILTYTDFPERMILPAVVITTIISILVAGSTVTRNARRKGWLHGALTGLLYMVILYVAGSLAFGDFSINRYGITMVCIGILTGAIGGILGINIKKPTKKKW